MAETQGMGGYVLPIVQTAANVAGGLFGKKRQYKFNKKLAAFQHSQNMELLKYQLDYNSPASQMARYKEAGLNPNLIYGQGSSGNMERAPQYPDIAPVDVQSVYAGLGTQIQQLKLMEAQTDLTNTKVEESGVKQDLQRAQMDLVKANPYMREEYVSAMVTQLKSAATIKAQEADFMLSKTQDVTGVRWERGFLKMQRELDLLGQRFQLSTSDQKIKSEILQGKEFQNALQEIQLKWMRDKEITPQHIYQGIMMLLSKMM